jgi:hypothetical protein
MHTCIDGCTMPGESINCLACDAILFYGALKELYALEGLGPPCIHAQPIPSDPLTDPRRMP